LDRIALKNQEILEKRRVLIEEKRKQKEKQNNHNSVSVVIAERDPNRIFAPTIASQMKTSSETIVYETQQKQVQNQFAVPGLWAISRRCIPTWRKSLC
jgi:hypothetical protein